MKTKARNKLSTSSSEAILRIRSHMFANDICGQNFEDTDQMLRLFTSDMYKNERRKPEINPQPSTSSTVSSLGVSTEEDQKDGSFEEIMYIDF